jgi:acetyltransferase-like isoleucine patch superfamily enzyme
MFFRKLRNYLLRELANRCLAPGLRMLLLRWSGIQIGRGAFVNMRLYVEDSYRGGDLVIGERAAIAPGLTCVIDSHPNDSRLARIPAFTRSARITIGADVWIGANVTILPGVTIGECAVVGAGAVVNRDVPPYAMVARVPARLIGDVRDKAGWV